MNPWWRRSFTVLDFLFIWKLSTLWITQPCSLYCELVHGPKVGFSMQEAHWGDKGDRANSQPGRLYTHHVWPRRLVVYSMYEWEGFPLVDPPRMWVCMCIHKIGRRISRTSSYTYITHKMGRSIVSESVCFSAICWDTLWLVCVGNSLQLTSPVGEHRQWNNTLLLWLSFSTTHTHTHAHMQTHRSSSNTSQMSLGAVSEMESYPLHFQE